MSWNRPNPVVEKSKNQTPRLNSRIIWIIFAVIGIGFCACIAWYFSRTSERGDKATSKPQSKPIPVVQSAPPVTNAVPNKPRFKDAPEGWDKPYPPQAYRPDGTLKRYSRYVKIVTNEFVRQSYEQKHFPNRADCDIAMLLNAKPGKQIIGNYSYGKGFVESFLRSLKHPIVINPDDPPKLVALKQAVIESREDLKRRYDAGEDIAAIMNETRKELQELGLYKKELEKQVRDIRNREGAKMSAESTKELLEAANKMLEDRGIDPIVMPDFVFRHIQMRYDNNQQSKTE